MTAAYRVYDLPTEVIRCDATTVSACHEVVDGGLVQFGHSKDDPSRPQIKLMTASLDPLGCLWPPMCSRVSKPTMACTSRSSTRVLRGSGSRGCWWSGDCKMSALDIRTYLGRPRQYYLSPLPLTGATAKQMPQWISQGLAKARGR